MFFYKGNTKYILNMCIKYVIFLLFLLKTLSWSMWTLNIARLLEILMKKKLTRFSKPFARNSCLHGKCNRTHFKELQSLICKREFKFMKRRKWLIIFKLIPQRDGLSSEFLYRVKFSCALREWKCDKDKFKHMWQLLCSRFAFAIILLKTRNGLVLICAVINTKKKKF